MSLRKLATLSTMTGLLMIGFAVLAGCDDNKIEEAHLPPNIGTDPASGGFNPATGTTTVNGVVQQVAQPVPPTVTNPAGAPFFGFGAGNKKLFLGCEGELDIEGNAVLAYNCPDFLSQTQANSFKSQLDALKPGNIDCHGLDGPKGAAGDDGKACTGLPLN